MFCERKIFKNKIKNDFTSLVTIDYVKYLRANIEINIFKIVFN